MIYVISIIVLLAIVELLIRTVIKTAAKKKLAESRKAVLSESLKQDYSSMSSSLKRVELQNPFARVLMVDKDTTALEKMRNTLVMEGYSVDTVISGQEAHSLSLLNHYDFVFTGETTQDIGGAELAKLIHERRQDIDVVMLTDAREIATPYELIKEGAIDFIKRPYAETHLNEFLTEQVRLRRAKIDKELKNVAKIEKEQKHDDIPKGYYLAKNHLWMGLEPSGLVKVGIDKFASDFLGIIDTIDFGNLNIIVSSDNPLFILKKQFRDLPMMPISQSRIVAANVKLRDDLEFLYDEPYKHWISVIEPHNIQDLVRHAMIGQEASDYIAQSYESLREDLRQMGLATGDFSNLQDKLKLENWITLINKYFVK